MKACFTTDPVRELEISGTALEWNAFGLAVQQDGSIIPCDKVDSPAPYAHAAQSIRVVHRKNCKIIFGIDSENEVVLEGDPAFLEKVSATATNFGNDFKKGEHIHIDFQGDDHFVSVDSMSAILMHEG